MPSGSNGQGVCPKCGGRGWLVETDSGAGTAKPCKCRELDVVPRLLAQAGIPDRYAGCTLGNFNAEVRDPGQKDQLLRAVTLSKRFVEGFVTEDGSFLESGLLFVGPPGVGKTHLAVAVLTELIQRYRVRGRYVDFTSLVHRIQSTFDPNSRQSKDQVLDPATNAELLVLDELGAQKPSDWVREMLYLIINARYTNRLPTIFTTNFELERESVPDAAPGMVSRREPLAERIGASLQSRLYQMARPVLIRASDFRREVKMAEHARSY